MGEPWVVCALTVTTETNLVSPILGEGTQSGLGTMKEHSMFFQLTKALLRMKCKSVEGETDGPWGSKTQSDSELQSKGFKKRKYHSEKVKRPKVDKEGNQKEKTTRRKLSLRNVAGERGDFTKSCPELDTNNNHIYGTGQDQVDSVDFNTLRLFRNLSIGEVEIIEINFEN